MSSDRCPRCGVSVFDEARCDCRRANGYQEAREAILRALGAASMCWDAPERAGGFNAGAAIRVADDLMWELGIVDDVPMLNPDHRAIRSCAIRDCIDALRHSRCVIRAMIVCATKKM